MPTEVILPKVDMDMASGKISRWFAKDGDTVTKGEPLFEIETDKAAMEVDAPASGTLRDVTGAPGVDIAVGSAVAWIYAEGEAHDGAASTADAGRPAAGPDPDVETDSDRLDAEEVVELTTEPAAPSQEDAPTGERRGVRATPLARRLAREHGLDLATLAGSGPMGRIQREDVERAAKAGKDHAVGAKSSAPAREQVPPRAAGRGPLAVIRLRGGEGTPIVLLHGFGSESASWRPLLAEIAGDAPVLGVDLPGHGGSVGCEASGFEALVALVEETIGAEGLAACHLVGHSLGGALATAVAAGVSSDVRSLLLLAPAGFGPDIDTAFAEGFARATEEAPIRSWLRHLVADPASISESFVRATLRGRADGTQARAQTRLATSLFSNGTQHFEVRSHLAGLAMPVKIVTGTADRVVPSAHFNGLPGRIALHVFGGTGHMPQVEQRDEVARLLRELTR